MPALRHILRVLPFPAPLLGLPLLGVWLAGKPVADYFEFPPLTRHVPHAAFSWPVFIAMAAGIVAFLAWWSLKTGRRSSKKDAAPATPPRRFPFPAWGWAALALTAAAWLLAWTRFGWFAPCQKYTFIPLWLGYILTVNALCFRRTGRCMLTHRTKHFLALFPASMLFWWLFEYLNRFVQNWYYLGAEGMGPLQYTVVASLSFSTVLPAVLGTAELLGAGRTDAAPLPVPDSKLRTAILAVSAGGLAGVGVWPDYLFPLLWLAPLGLMLALNGSAVRQFGGSAAGEEETSGGFAAAPFPSLASLMLAGLVCGFFWEMWNIWSQAKWVYSVPFVDRFHLFEMPILGYAGYLPFGVECAAAAAWIRFVFSPQNIDNKGETT